MFDRVVADRRKTQRIFDGNGYFCIAKGFDQTQDLDIFLTSFLAHPSFQ
jgi:hypothetical protein